VVGAVVVVVVVDIAGVIANNTRCRHDEKVDLSGKDGNIMENRLEQVSIEIGEIIGTQ
jgi:hypothetical protein